MDGNRRIIEKLRSLYKMYGKPELVDDYVSVGATRIGPICASPASSSSNKHLKGDANTPVKDVDFKPIDGKRLRVFPTDDDVPKDAINARVDETFVAGGRRWSCRGKEVQRVEDKVSWVLKEKTLRFVAEARRRK